MVLGLLRPRRKRRLYSNRLVGVGWDGTDAPELQEYFKTLKVGDIVYIKAAHLNISFNSKKDCALDFVLES